MATAEQRWGMRWGILGESNSSKGLASPFVFNV